MYLRNIRMRHAALLGDLSSVLVASSSFTLSSDCSFFYPELVDCMFFMSPGFFYHLPNHFKGEYEDFRDGGITVSFLAEKYRMIEVSIFRYLLS